jgi:hypothetical protein
VQHNKKNKTRKWNDKYFMQGAGKAETKHLPKYYSLLAKRG